jgi:putative transposase
METFFCDEDYQEYLSLLGHWCGEFEVRIWAYCLMPNHVHLILLPSTAGGLARAVGEIHQRYTRRINFRQGWRGHLWQGRFASFVMSEKHLMGATRYVERNPVKADLVARAEDWRWSSAAAHCGAEGDCPAEREWLIDRTAGMTSTWSEHLAWRDDTELSRLMRQRENTGRPLGDTDFVKLMGNLLSRDLLPKKPGPKGPRKKAKSNN